MKLSKKLVAIAVAGAVVFGGLTATQAASADLLTGAQTGTVTINPTSGSVSTPAANAFGTMLSETHVTNGCPVGFQQASQTVMVQDQAGVPVYSNLSLVRNPSTALVGGAQGLDATPIHLTQATTAPNNNPYVSNYPFTRVGTTFNDGAFEIRVYCRASATSSNNVTDKYFSIAMKLAGDTWSVDTPKTPTELGLTGATNGDNSVALTATVKDAGTKATLNTAGNVTFNQVMPSAVIVATVPAAAGIAATNTAVLIPGTYQFTATYNGDTAYAGSTVVGSFTVIIAGSNQVISNLTVTIPTTGTLGLTGQANPSVAFGKAVQNGGLLQASGVLPSLQVNDTRNLGALPWSLTGKVGDFTAAGGKIIDGKALGWTPALVGTLNAGTVGASVLANTTGALKAPGSALAIGSVVNGTPLTSVGATLQFEVPANTATGDYAATLTLTLI